MSLGARTPLEVALYGSVGATVEKEGRDAERSCASQRNRRGPDGKRPGAENVSELCGRYLTDTLNCGSARAQSPRTAASLANESSQIRDGNHQFSSGAPAPLEPVSEVAKENAPIRGAF